MTQRRSGQRRLRGLIRTAPDAILFADPDTGEIVEANHAVESLFGYSREELIGTHQVHLHPTEEADRYRQLFEDHLHTQPAVISQFDDGSPVYVVTADDRKIPVEINAWQIETDGGPLFQGVFRDITERRRRERRLNQYREAVGSTVNPIAAVDDSFRYLFANSAYSEPLGYDEAEISGLTVPEVLGEDTFAEVKPYLERGLAGQASQFHTTRNVPSGETREYEATYSPVQNDEGDTYGLIGSFNDITERIRREEELERLFDGMDDAAFVHSVDGSFLVVNETAVERYGYSEAELYSMSPLDLDTEAEARKVPDRIETIREEGAAVFETVHETKSGETIPVEISSSVIQYKGNQSILSIARDISRRKESERKFEVLFNNASDAMVHTKFEDGDPVVRDVNPAFSETFGFERDTLVGRSLTEVFDSTATAYEMREINRRMQSGDFFRMEVQRNATDGTRDFLLRSIPVDPAAGEYYRVYTDITERKEHERTLVRQRDELQTLNRLNELLLGIIQELIDAESRGQIEEMVCRELAESPLFQFAWIGERHPENGDVEMRASSGTDAEFADVAEFSTEGSESAYGPASQALESGEIQVVQNASADPRFRYGTDEVIEGDVRSIAAIPLTHQGSVYAVIVIYAPREYAFSGRELAGLETLGKIVEFSINAIKNRKLLTTDTVAELEFDVSGSALSLVQLSAELSCQIELDGVVESESDDTLLMYLKVRGTTAEAFLELAESLPDIQTVSLIAEDPEGDHRVEVTVDCEVHRDLVSRHKASIRAIALDAGDGTYVFDVPLTEDVREIVDTFQSAFPAVSFKSKHEREFSIESPAKVSTELKDVLTDRQYEILLTALLSGYFEWPRDSTAEDVSETVGITSSTFQYHLRNAQRTLFANIFDRED